MQSSNKRIFVERERDRDTKRETQRERDTHTQREREIERERERERETESNDRNTKCELRVNGTFENLGVDDYWFEQGERSLV